MNKTNTMVWVTFQREGIHCFPAAATDPRFATGGWDDVSYLANEHRHMFHFKVSIEVFHGDREIEFIQFKKWLIRLYSGEEGKPLNLHHKSCEMISDELYEKISNRYPGRYIEIEVSEDGENGSFTKYESK